MAVLFDPAIFDSAIFDTGNSTPAEAASSINTGRGLRQSFLPKGYRFKSLLGRR